jgi:hypothetical protein
MFESWTSLNFSNKILFKFKIHYSKHFFVNLIVVDEDPEVTKDFTLAPPIDYHNYIINIPIRPY